MSREPSPGLLAVQRAFAQFLHEQPAQQARRAPPLADAQRAERIGVYANNARQFFRSALAATFPVLHRRVGDDFFRQLAHRYRAQHPSRSGDLHWVGAAFPAWLGDHLAGTEYAWLGDLARLEWACEQTVTAACKPSLGLAALGDVPAAALDDVRVDLQPCLRLVSSEYPVVSVWQANQADTAPAPVDLARGAERCACACVGDGPVVYGLAVADFALLEQLAAGATLGAAVAASGAGADALAGLLRWAFDEGLVVGLLSPSARV